MAGPRYRAAPAEVLHVAPLDDVLTAVFHRSSGITHLLAEPAPEILAALGGEWLNRDELLDRLAERFDLLGADTAALDARLEELVVSGLVEAAPAPNTAWP